METKRCSKCKQEKSLGDFSVRSYKTGKPASRCKLCAAQVARETSKERWAAMSAESKLRKRALRHGINDLMYNDLMELQGGKCAVCKTAEPEAIDHDHRCCPGTYSCGQCVRGLLCGHCNRGLGHFNDEIDRLESAIEYLKIPAHGWSLTQWGLMATRKIDAINRQRMGA